MFRKLWKDESGSVLSAELATVATVTVVGAVAGLNVMAKSINGEFLDLSHSFRSLNQSYSYRGFASKSAFTAGSCYQQAPVDQSHAELDAYMAEQEKAYAVPQAEPEAAKPATPKKKKKKKEIRDDESESAVSDFAPAAMLEPRFVPDAEPQADVAADAKL